MATSSSTPVSPSLTAPVERQCFACPRLHNQPQAEWRETRTISLLLNLWIKNLRGEKKGERIWAVLRVDARVWCQMGRAGGAKMALSRVLRPPS